eukprot:scaffold859_cov234-Ochromonas_danica.AAC.18
MNLLHNVGSFLGLTSPNRDAKSIQEEERANHSKDEAAEQNLQTFTKPLQRLLSSKEKERKIISKLTTMLDSTGKKPLLPLYYTRHPWSVYSEAQKTRTNTVWANLSQDVKESIVKDLPMDVPPSNTTTADDIACTLDGTIEGPLPNHIVAYGFCKDINPTAGLSKPRPVQSRVQQLQPVNKLVRAALGSLPRAGEEECSLPRARGLLGIWEEQWWVDVPCEVEVLADVEEERRLSRTKLLTIWRTMGAGSLRVAFVSMPWSTTSSAKLLSHPIRFFFSLLLNDLVDNIVNNIINTRRNVHFLTNFY